MLSLAGGGALLLGQSAAPPKAALPSPMEKAIERLAKGETLPNQAVLNGPGTDKHQCSVPLLEMPVDKTTHHTMRLLKPSDHLPMPNLKPPAPACK